MFSDAIMASVAPCPPHLILANPGAVLNPPENLTLTLASSEQWLVSSLGSSSTSLELAALHGVALKTGLARRDAVLSHLLLLQSTSPASSLLLLRSLCSPTDSPFPFNSLISTLSRFGSHLPALEAYSILRFLAVPIDRFSLPPVLRSATFLSSIAAGLDAHALAFKTGLADHLPVATALIRFYFSLERPAHARLIFDRCRTRDSILWNTTIAGLIRCHEFDSAHHLFGKMLPRDRSIASWNSMVDMYCNKMGNVAMGRKVFDEMPKKDIVSWNVMISGYARIMDCTSARKLFDQMPERDVVSWNVLIACYVKQGFFSDAVDLFRKMQGLIVVRPNEVTVTEVLTACSHLGALDLATWIHAYIERQHMPIDLQLTTALVDVYGKCGCIENARKMFNQAWKRDTFLCSTMMEVLAMHGMADEVFKVFNNMRGEGIKPNDVAMIGLLKACAYKGLVVSGLGWFNKMEDELGLSPRMEHYGCIVELLGRAGKLDDAYQLILNMPMEPSPVVWSSLLNACRIHGDITLAEKAGNRLIALEPRTCGNYILLSNVYSAGRRWKDAENMRKLMKENGIVKKPGCSSIEVGNWVHKFYAGDRSHPQCREIYEMLHRVVVRLEPAGYRPESLELHEEGGTKNGLFHHSEERVSGIWSDEHSGGDTCSDN